MVWRFSGAIVISKSLLSMNYKGKYKWEFFWNNVKKVCKEVQVMEKDFQLNVGIIQTTSCFKLVLIKIPF